jgi:hypothetical protein
MANGTVISVPIGTDFPFQVSLLDTAGDPVTTYTSSDTPFCEIWAGQDQPVLLTPTASWITAPAGTVQVMISGDTTTTITPGKYWLRNGVTTSSGLTVTMPDTFIEFTASPGSATTLPTYCDLKDMQLLAPWVDQLQDMISDESGFATYRQRARQWLDRVIQRNRFNSSSWGTLGLGGAAFVGWFWTGWYAQGQDDPVLQSYLDQDLLMTGEPKMVATMTAAKALGYLCKAQIGPDDKATAWQQRGYDFDADAEEMAMKYTAEIDINDDGYADIVIPCGRATLR